MLISKNKRSFVVLLLFIAGLFIPNLIVCQCNLFISDEINPSTCGTSDGSFSVSSYGTCEKTISVYKGNTKLITRQNSLTIIDLPSGVYKVVAERGCGCSTAITRYVSLTSSEETVLIPYVNIGSGKYESDNVEVCSGSSVDLGVQTLGISGLRISGPNGYVDVTPDGSGFWRFTNLKFSQSGIYTINYTNPKGCTSSVNIRLTVKNLTVNIGNDREACVGTNQTLTANVTGSSICKENCTANVDSLLVRWSLDQCNANGLNNQLDYTEFLPEYPSLGNCTNIYATNIYKQKGDHSCTPVLGSYDGDIGMCIMAQESCNPANYEPDKAIKFEVTLTPAEAGRITGLSFREQSPLVWITTNGATGPNNYNTKYLLRVYKNNILIHSVDGKDTERSWNLEEFDFSSDPKFAISETTTFRFELRGYCVTENGGNMAGWELDDIRVFGGCCTGLTSNSSLGYLWSTGETTSSINVNPNETSLYSVTVQDCSGCSKSDTLKVTVFPLPVPSIAGDTTICKGGTTVLTANGGGTYLWSTGATSASLSVNPALTQIYTVTVTSINNCTAVSSVKVLVKDLPSPVITGVSEICAGDSTTLTASGALSYQWNTGQTSASITVKPKISTEYRVMAVDQNGCMEYTSVFITVNQLPIPKISGDTIICAGKSTTLTASGGAMYNWNTGSTTVSISISPSSNQNYSVTVVDGKGCSASTFVKVTVNPLPIVTISGNSSFCTGVSSTLTASGGGTYLWSTGATTTSITINPSLTTTYTVTVTNEQGCTATASRMASVMGLPKAKIEGEVKICSGDAITLTASGGVAYRWSTGQTTSVINVSPSIATMYKVTVTDANGCTDTSVHGVNVNSKPEVTISGNDKFCTGNSTVLTANVTGKTFCEKDCKDEQLLRWTLDQCNAEGLTNQLSYSEFTANISSKGGLASVSGSNVARNRGDHSCTFDGTGGVGMCFGVLADCDPNQYNPINALRFSVTLRPAEVGNLSKLTFREQSPLNWQTTNGATGINNYNQKYLIRVYKNGALVYSQNEMNTERIWNLESFDFSTHPEFRITTETEFTFELYGYCVVERGGTAGWEIDDIKIFGGECPSSPSVDNITYLWSTGETTKSISVAPSTTSSYSVTVSDCNNCKGSDDILVTVYPLPVLRIDGDNIICVGESTTLVASGGTSFIWNNGATNASISVNPIVTSNYTVTITDVNGCSASKTLEVTVNSLPVVNITGNNVICIGGSTTLTAGGGVSYTWSNGANTTSVTVSPTVNTIYTVTATDINGCKANTSISVKVNPLPIPSISGDNIICVGESTTLVATGGVTYMWNNASTGNSISVSPVVTTTYTVTVTDTNGCAASTGISVTVNPLPIPSVSGDNIICLGESTTLVATGGVSYIWNNATTGSSIVVSPAVNTMYSVTVTDANGCVASRGITVTVNPLPKPVIDGDFIICIGETTILSVNGGVSYVWSNGNTGSIQTVSPIATTNYTVTVTDANGCRASTSKSVTVNPTPNVQITGNKVICIGQSTTLSATGGSIYLWNNANTSSSIVVSPLATTMYTVTVTDNNGCSSTSKVTVTVNPLPSPSIGGENIICLGKSTTLTASGGVSYIWSTGSTSVSISVNPSVSTVYNVTVTDVNGCVASTNKSVTVHPLPNPLIAGNTVICLGESTTLVASGGITYRWNTGLNTATISVSPTITTSYSVTVTDTNGCSGSKVVVVTVNPLPSPKITGDVEICKNECTTLTASGGIQYVWSGIVSSGFKCNGAFYIGGPQGGVNQSLFSISDASVLSKIGDLGTNNVNGIAYYCQGGNTPYIYGMKMKGTSVIDAAKANFVRVDPRNASVTILGEMPQPPNPYGSTGTTGIMAYIGTASKEGIYYFPAVSALINPATFQIVDYTVYIGSIDLNNHGNGANVSYRPIFIQNSCKPYMDACIVAFQRFSADPTTGEPSGGIQDWALSPDGQTIYSFFGIENALFRLNLGTLSTSCVAAPASNSGFIGTTGVKTDEFGGIFFKNNILYGLQVDRGRLFTIDQTTGLLTLISSELPIDYRGDNASCEDCGINGTNPINVAEVIVCPLETTIFSVKVTDANGCTAIENITVKVNSLPEPVITGNNVICKGENTTLTVSGGASFIWNTGATATSINVSPQTSTTYQVTATDIKGCTGTGSITVRVNELPKPLVVGNSVICIGKTASLVVSGGVSFIWSNGATTAFANFNPTSTIQYSVTVTDVNGCKASTGGVITIHPLPEPLIVGNNILCIGGSNQITASGGVSYRWNDDSTEASKTISIPGTYTVTVTSINGCNASTSKTFVQDTSIPNLGASNDGPLTCAKTSVTLTAQPGSGVTYSWSGGGTNQIKSVSSSGSYTVTVTKISTGCSQTATTIVNQDISVPSTTATNDGPLICTKTSVTLTATGGGSYVWSGGGTSSTKSVTSAGTFTVTVTSSNGCTSVSSTIVDQNITPPLVTASNDGPLTCTKTSVTLTATGGGSYAWSGGGTSSTKPVTSIGTYTVTVTSSNGCTSTASTIVGQNITPPLVTGNNDGPLTCTKTSVTLTATGGGSYAWSGGGTSATKSVISAGTYTVTVTSSNGCTSTSSTIVDQNLTPPVVTATNDGPLTCTKTSVTLTATGGGSYAWSGGGTSATKSVISAGTYTVTVTSSNGCTSIASTIVDQNLTPPVVTATNDGPLTCTKTSVTLTATGGGSYAWSGGGTSSTKSVTSAGTYTVTVTSSNGCTSTSSTFVDQNKTPPLVTATNDGPLTCTKTSVTLTATGGGSYIWSGGGTSSIKSVSEPGTYVVTVTASNGCTSSANTTVQQNIVQMTVTATNDGPLTCTKLSATLTATGGGTYEWSGGGNSSTKSVTLSGTYTVTITSSNGCTATATTILNQDITPPSVVSTNDGPLTCIKINATLSATGGGTYSWSGGGTSSIKIISSPGIFTVTVTSSNGCSATANTTVEQNITPPTVSVNNEGILTCSTTNILLSASGGISYVWSNGATSSTTSVTLPGLYTVTVTASNGCTATSNTSIDQNITPPSITASNDGPLTCIKTSVILTATGGGNYAWSGGGTSSSKSVTSSGTYTVTVTSANRCTATAITIVEILNTVPTARITGNNKICEGGKTTLTASGGSAYIWSTGQSSASIEVQPIVNTSYTFTVTNALGCTSSVSETVMIKPKPDIDLDGLDKICKGDSSFIVATGYTNNECPGVCNVAQPQVLASWNLNACQSVMDLGTHLDYSEFVPIVSKANCTNVTAGNVHRLPGNKHSCTPGPNGSIAMCIGSQKTCNPAKVNYSQALRFQITLTPAQSGQITGLEFFEQSPERFQWVDGVSGANNFAKKFLLRISKNGEYIYYEDDIATKRTWGVQIFNFDNNDNFRTLVSATYLFELVPYCTVNNGASESVWDIDEIKVLGGCCAGSAVEIPTYKWSNGDSGTSITVKPTENTKYTVTVTDCCGCTNVKEYGIVVACLMADLGPDRMISIGQTVTLTPVITGKSICDQSNPDNNGVKYLWSNGATTSSITVTPSASTFYRVTVTDCNDCVDTESLSIHLMMPRPVVVYPNPASDRVNLVSESEFDRELSVRILSSDGKTVVTHHPEIVFNSTTNISIIIPDKITDGMYYIEVRTGLEKFTEKLMLIKK